jgi:hypothetical protein
VCSLFDWCFGGVGAFAVIKLTTELGGGVIDRKSARKHLGERLDKF